MDNLSFFDLVEQKEKKGRADALCDLPDVVHIQADDPRRMTCLMWANNYQWHMPVHECDALIAVRNQYRVDHPENIFVRPVVYCWPDYCKTFKGLTWSHIFNSGHEPTSVCPYCDAKLNAGEGDVIMERRYDNRPYAAPFERRWGQEAFA